MTLRLTRRDWLTRQAQTAAALLALTPRSHPSALRPSWIALGRGTGQCGFFRGATQAERLDHGPLQALALQAVEAARTAGAQYADARLTRVIIHRYGFGNGDFWWDTEEVGVGVRALVQGYWGFAASSSWTSDEVVRLARDAVAQATENAKGTPRIVDLGHIPIVTGTWATPIGIDPFAIPVEEKLDAIEYWKECARQAKMWINEITSWLYFVRQERVAATSEGSVFTQTLYESAGSILVQDEMVKQSPTIQSHGVAVAGKGWELFLEAKIPDQFPQLREEIQQQLAIGTKPATVGRYTLVCDGATMATLLDRTLGIATQLDRALGYEANAGGTSFIDDPLGMVGHLQVASPLVTLTANRSAPTQLGTVKWDDEGVEPPDFPLLKDGVLTDFQTTREQAAWLAPYYHAQGRSVRSHGCAAAQDAHYITMQHMPNLAVEPSASAIRLEDLVADVKDGILVERGGAGQVDFQARNGLLGGDMREIKSGRLGRRLVGGAVQFNTLDLWKHLLAIGGRSTQAVVGTSQYGNVIADDKGQPAQTTSHSVQAVAATIANQSLIDPARQA